MTIFSSYLFAASVHFTQAWSSVNNHDRPNLSFTSTMDAHPRQYFFDSRRRTSLNYIEKNEEDSPHSVSLSPHYETMASSRILKDGVVVKQKKSSAERRRVRKMIKSIRKERKKLIAMNKLLIRNIAIDSDGTEIEQKKIMNKQRKRKTNGRKRRTLLWRRAIKAQTNSQLTNNITLSNFPLDELAMPNISTESSSSEVVLRRRHQKKMSVTNVHELRSAILDHGMKLEEINFDIPFLKKDPKPEIESSPDQQKVEESPVFNHEVLKLMEQRVLSNSKPGQRSPEDKSHLALAIEGGGMRGAVSAGMACAIFSLGLQDTFDSVYGSSAGSVVGAYMISRQLCFDVYSDVLTTAKTSFVSKKRLIKWILQNEVEQLLNAQFSKKANPGMNISYVIDTVMNPENGLRPLDIDTFKWNDQKQPLRIVTSAVAHDGEMVTRVLGSKECDFFDDTDRDTGTIRNATTHSDGSWHGFFACLAASMTVPAAAGPPLRMKRNKDSQQNSSEYYFDAFCYEPIPYRSAVEEGATHVMALRTRPDAAGLNTEPGIYEKRVAPLYFNSNNFSQVSNFFEKGGQQYLYVEDYLTLEEGKNSAIGSKGILVPPNKLLYGVELNNSSKKLIQERHSKWKRAHLLPIAVPKGVKELSVLSVDRDEVVDALRDGFAAAFDLLVGFSNIDFKGMDGKLVAELLFPLMDVADDVLKNPVYTLGEPILSKSDNSIKRDNETPVKIRMKIPKWVSKTGQLTFRINEGAQETNGNSAVQSNSIGDESLDTIPQLNITNPCKKQQASLLLALLPGTQEGKMPCVRKGLLYSAGKSVRTG